MTIITVSMDAPTTIREGSPAAAAAAAVAAENGADFLKSVSRRHTLKVHDNLRKPFKIGDLKNQNRTELRFWRMFAT